MTAPNTTNRRSIMSDIDGAEEEIKLCYHRLDVLERNLKYRPMTNDEREKGEKDVAELRKTVKIQETQLQALRKDNRGSSVIAVILMICAFLCFGLYHMYMNSNKNTNLQPPEPLGLKF